MKFKILAGMWECVRLRLPGKPYLAKYDMQLWDKYAEFLLGGYLDKNSMLYARNLFPSFSQKNSVVWKAPCKPSWARVL